MKLINVSNKIIHIGSTALMPDDSMNVKKGEAELPSVKVMIEMGFLKIDDSKEREEKIRQEAKAEAKAEAQAEQAAAEAEAEAPAPTERKRPGRKAKETAETVAEE